MWNVPVDGVLSTTVTGGWAGGFYLLAPYGAGGAGGLYTDTRYILP